MGKHTPGPWRVSNGHTYLVHGKADPKTDKPYGFVCSVGWTSTTDGKANAYLIAAAPDLLEALKWAIHHCENVCSLADRNDPDKRKFEIAKKAIAMAEGRE